MRGKKVATGRPAGQRVRGRRNNQQFVFQPGAAGQGLLAHAGRVDAAVDLTGVSLDYQPVQTPSPAPEATITVWAGTANLRNGPFSAAAPSTNAMGSDGDFDFGTLQLKLSYRF